MEIVLFPDPVLRKATQPVEEFDDELRRLVREMKEAMVCLQGVGLAAPQVGISRRLLVLSVEGKLEDARALINPRIRTSGERRSAQEGCLSFPGIYAEIVRPDRVLVEAFDEHGKPQVFEASGWLSRIIQHEYDHLEGRLFIDRMSPADRIRIRKELKSLKADYERGSSVA
jgi:peptide deformylase